MTEAVLVLTAAAVRVFGRLAVLVEAVLRVVATTAVSLRSKFLKTPLLGGLLETRTLGAVLALWIAVFVVVLRDKLCSARSQYKQL